MHLQPEKLDTASNTRGPLCGLFVYTGERRGRSSYRGGCIGSVSRYVLGGRLSSAGTG